MTLPHKAPPAVETDRPSGIRPDLVVAQSQEVTMTATMARTCAVRGCERPFRARGMCSTHWLRWDKRRKSGEGERSALASVLAGTGLPLSAEPRRLHVSDDTRLRRIGWTVTSTGCWEWGGTRSQGYGLVRQGGRTVVAHRVAYEAWVGPIPEGLEIDHLCMNPACIAPNHLEPVTHAENMRRRYAARRARTTGDAR